ncbi:uncharacterized protein LOC125008537, partial [Mugil cephalus]|uniref:uncharacterized protein LOC125008537 n=1 Tax=Mugil cephalus TaxID=48193 RepID=UPI001FB76459
ILSLLLFIDGFVFLSGCSDDHKFVTKTVDVGQDVTLSCARQETSQEESLFWIRIVSGTRPEFLGGTLTYDVKDSKTPQITTNTHITAKQESETFVLHISQTKLSDTGLYYCLKTTKLKMTFMEEIFLIIKGPEPHITTVTEASPSDPDLVSLQCSVLSDSDNKTCPEDHRVYWFRAKSDESHPSLIYTHQNNTDECERSPETHSKKCVYSFSKDVSSSDAGTYYCAVATCGEILFGNGTKLDNKDSAAVDVQTNNGAKKDLQRGEDTLVYSAVIFTMMNGKRGGRRNSGVVKRERMYMALKAFSLD